MSADPTVAWLAEWLDDKVDAMCEAPGLVKSDALASHLHAAMLAGLRTLEPSTYQQQQKIADAFFRALRTTLEGT